MNHGEKIQELLVNVTVWSELKMQLEQFNTSQTETTNKDTEAGKLFEHFAKAYFKAEPEQNQLYKEVWLFDEIPLSIKDKLNFPHRDFGIDLLLQDTQDRFTAVQCKFKNDERSILNWSKDKIGNAFGLAEKCDNVLVFTNASNIHSVAQTREKFKFLGYSDLLNLKGEDFEAIRQYLKTNAKPPFKKLSPLPHQSEAIDAVVEYLKTNDRGQLILPCGAGKTLTALWINEKIQSKNSLILFPSLALLRQFKAEWSRNRSVDFDYLCVCSEKDIDVSKEDTTVTHTYEITGEVTTIPSRVSDFIKSDNHKIVFSTYQSLPVIETALKNNTHFKFDLIVCDEAHRTAGGKTNNLFTLIHNNERIPGIKRLYMTATPKVVSNKLKSRLGDDYELLCDMSNPEVFGGEAYRMTFGTAIDKEILVDYKIIGIGVTNKQVKEFIDSRRYVNTKFSIDEIARNYALDLAMEKHSASHCITFHHQVALAREFSERHNSFFGDRVYSQYVEGNQPTSYRASVLNEFKNHPLGVVSNARCLTEGVDVPTIDLIYFSDPKTSKIDIVQASGRALRKDWHGKKKMGYIVVPIFHHIDDDIDKEIEKKPFFLNLVSVIRSLCDQDERLQAEIDEIAFEKGERKSKRIEISYSDSEIEKIIKLDGLDKQIREFLFDQIIEKTRNFFEVMFKQLVQYKAEHNTTTVSRRTEGLLQLANWVMEVRRQYHAGKLAKHKIEKLNSIDFDWKGEQRLDYLPPDQKWQKNYTKLQKYFQENGNSDVPARYEKDKSLATWVVGQRVKYDNGKLSEEQIELLEALKINWDPKNVYPQLIQGLLEYKAKHGDMKVPQGSKVYPQLARQVFRLRRIKRHGVILPNGDISLKEGGRLPKWVVDKLNSEGFEWSVSHADWDDRFEELKSYFNENGHSNVKQSENISLYYWCYKQRREQKNLEQDEIQKLKSVDFVFEIHKRNEDDIFLERIIELKEYFEKYKTFQFSNDDSENRSLKNWLTRVRKNFSEGKLAVDKIELLKSISYNLEDLNNDNEAWAEKFEQLKAYYNEHKIFAFPKSEQYSSLRSWLQYQRVLNKQDKLQPERKTLIEGLGYSFGKNYAGVYKFQKRGENGTISWSKRINELKEYYKQKNTFYIPNTDKENQSLLNWLRTQRQLYREGVLDETKVQQLTEIGYDFSMSFKGVKKGEITSKWRLMLKKLKEYYDKNGTFYLSPSIPEQKTLALWVNTQKTFYNQGKLGEDKERELGKIGFSLTTRYFQPKEKPQKKSHEDNWNEKLEWLKEYYANNQTFFIARNDLEHKDLLIWLDVQRLYFREGKLKKDREEKLKQIGYSFDVKHTGKTRPKKEKIEKVKKPTVSNWDEQYLKLLNYKILNGNCNVSRSYSDKSLAFWVTKQRSAKRDGKLSKEEINKLDLLGFEWRNTKKLSDFDKWKTSYDKLKEFFTTHGHSSATKTNSTTQIATWVIQQRFQKKKGTLKPEYEKLLNEINFVWNPELNILSSKPDDETWLQRLDELREYKSKFGDTNVSQLNKEYYSLSRWVNDQRQNKRKQKLSQFRIDKLNEIGFIWDAKTAKNDALFNERFNELIQYKKIYNDLNVPQNCLEFPKLGTWLSQIKHRGTTPERTERLKSIGLEI